VLLPSLVPKLSSSIALLEQLRRVNSANIQTRLGVHWS
jgi:hypothetical protein